MSDLAASAPLCLLKSQLSQSQVYQRSSDNSYVHACMCACVHVYVTCDGVMLDMLDGKGVKVGGGRACCAQHAIQSTACKARGSIHAAALLSCFTYQQCLHGKRSL